MMNILFVCVENSCRSQMAEAFARESAGSHIRAFSAGSRPSGAVNPQAVGVMREKGIDISGAVSKGFADLPVREFDYVIGMGCGDVCPLVPGKEHRNWQIEDPKGKGEAVFRTVRDAIAQQVASFVKEITTA